MLLARKAPPAPAERAGRAGSEPTVMSTADRAVITFGWSVVRDSSAWQALTSHTGACVMVVGAVGYVSEYDVLRSKTDAPYLRLRHRRESWLGL